MMKKNSMASKFEKSWTVLLVDGQGRIRRIRNFRQKLWAVISISLIALILAGIMGAFYGRALQKQMALSKEVATLQQELLVLQQQNDVLKARAVRIETQAAKTQKVDETRAASPAPSPKPIPVVAKAETPSPPPPPAPAPEAPQADEKVMESTPAPEQPEEKQAPQVDASDLKVSYAAETQTLDAQFVIKNTGQGSAGGRAVVVLHTEEGPSQLRLALPTVPLRRGQPVGNRGRRFSIARFMTLKLNRKFAEPGTNFVGAVVYAYTLDGEKLLEKPFELALEIPKPKPPQEVAPTTEVQPEEKEVTVAPFGITLPEDTPQENTGAQP